VQLGLGDGTPLHVINVHLKSKIPTDIDGQKIDAFTWRSADAWAEGSFISSMKRMSQALEVRRLVDQILDGDPDARIVVAGDFNAAPDEVPVLAIRGDVEDTGNGDLSGRVLVPIEHTIPGPARYTLYRNQIVDLQFSQGFSLPRNLCFIATMNTADRSIRSIDVALRRRFEIFECVPDPEALDRFYALGRGENYVTDLVTGFTALNEALTEGLDRHHTIGQSFFMADEMSKDRLARVWNRQIYPLIEEYFFDQPDLAADYSLFKFWPSVDA
jgi:hypothetical protein